MTTTADGRDTRIKHLEGLLVILLEQNKYILQFPLSPTNEVRVQFTVAPTKDEMQRCLRVLEVMGETAPAEQPSRKSLTDFVDTLQTAQEEQTP